MERASHAMFPWTAALLVALGGCQCGGGDDAGACTTNEQCPGGLCVGGRCVSPDGAVFECRNW